MYCTRQVINLLRSANPDSVVTEERIRRILRTEKIVCPSLFAGRLAWSDGDLETLADCLDLRSPVETGREEAL